MRAERARWLGGGVIALILACIAVAANPSNLPQSWLEWWLGRKLPAGSSIVAVRDAIESEQWKNVDDWRTDSGFLVQVSLGREWPPRRRHVMAFFVFDSYGRLLGTSVRKSDSLTSPSGVVLPR
ncbi:MAG TPA: hypothetical protein VF266_27480 [Thermoanaerobaculia bacterium]